MNSRVLIVGDHPVSRELPVMLIKPIIAQSPFSVLEAVNGACDHEEQR